MRLYASKRRHTPQENRVHLKEAKYRMTEWNKLIPKPKSRFLRVKCLKCGNEQLLYSNATNKVTCNVCGEVLAEPTGGRAKIKGEIQTVLE
jgi:small subunit ribosomal protein S27e